jgi:hypothetical protein
VESAVRLGTYIPFEPAAEMLAHFTKVEVGKDTLRRMTERAGGACVQVQGAELARLETELSICPEGPAVQQLSVDGTRRGFAVAGWRWCPWSGGSGPR